MWKICYMIFTCIIRNYNILNNTNVKLEKTFSNCSLWGRFGYWVILMKYELHAIQICRYFHCCWYESIFSGSDVCLYDLVIGIFTSLIITWIFQSCLVYFTSYLEDNGLVLQVNKKYCFWASNLLATWFLLDFNINRLRCRRTSSSQVPWYWNI